MMSKKRVASQNKKEAKGSKLGSHPACCLQGVSNQNHCSRSIVHHNTMSSDTPASTSTPVAADAHGSDASEHVSNGSDLVSTKTATPPKATTAASTSYTRHNAPQRSKFKPRWHTQPYMMFLALRSMPNYTAARQQIISAAVELDRKFSAERGLPRVFTGKVKKKA